MMGAPGIVPNYALQYTKSDDLAQETKQTLEEVAEVSGDVLKEALEEAGRLLKNPQASEQDRQDMLDRIQKLTQGADAASQSVKDFAQADLFEQKVVQETLSDEMTPEDYRQRVDTWAEQAAAYYSRSQNGLSKAGRALENDPALDRVLDRKSLIGTLQDKKKAFWAKIGVAALNLETFVQRIYSLPDRMAATIVESTERRAAVVNESFQSWAAQTSGAYQKLREEATLVAHQAVDNAGAVKDVLLDRVGGVYQKAETHLGTTGVKIMSSIYSFIADKAVPALKSTALDVQQSLGAQVLGVTQDYAKALSKRRESRQTAQPEVSAGPATP